MTLVGKSFQSNPAFTRRHPYADALLRPVPVSALVDQRPLDQFRAWLAEQTGVNVALDLRAIEDIGVRGDTPIECSRGDDVPELADSRISLRSAVRLALNPLSLLLLEEPNRLLITTPESAESRLMLEVYPVADLLDSTQVAPPWLLNNPYLDHDEAARSRIEAKLKRPLDARFERTPLADVITRLATDLGEPLWTDQAALSDVGVDWTQPVTASYRRAPAAQLLSFILEQQGLTYTIQDEALVITSKDEAELASEVHLYSGRGLVMERLAQRRHRPAGGRWRPSGMRGMFGAPDLAVPAGIGGMGGMFGAPPAGGLAGADGSHVTPPADELRGVIGVGIITEEASSPQSGDQSSAIPGAPINADPAPPQEPPAASGLAVRPTEPFRYEIDSDSLYYLVIATVAPGSWDAVGGSGSIKFFPHTLDFVVGQTREVHQRLEVLWDRLRAQPTALFDQGGIRPARESTADQFPREQNLDGLVELVTSTVSPLSWDAIGGSGSITADAPRMALVVSQTPDVHDAVDRLLTLLRRSRYAAVHGGRPWGIMDGDGASGPAAAEPRLTADTAPWRLADFPEPRPAELQALQIRRDPSVGSWTWRRGPVERGQRAGLAVAGEQLLTVRRSADQREFVLPQATIRTTGDDARILWPGLALVEHGDYGEPLRRAIDVQLPWLPHRSNDELARLFDVRVVAADGTDTDQDGQPEVRDAVVLHFVPSGLAASENTYLRIAYSRRNGLPVLWESYLDGELTGRIHFSSLATDGEPHWRQAVLQDAKGRELVRWELAACASEPPDLDGGWDDYLHLDRRGAPSLPDAPFAVALEAIRKLDWAQADELLGRLPDAKARRPLARLLRAWCVENIPHRVRAERVYWRLVDVAQSGLPDLMRLITPENFPSLDAHERYALLCLQRESSRSVDDWDRLARAAIAAERLRDALSHIESALAGAPQTGADQERGADMPAAKALGDDGRQQARQRLRIELLLRLDRPRQAVAAAERWVAQDRPDPDSLATLAEVFARFGQADDADKLFEHALSAARAAGQAAPSRSDLLRRWAAVQSGMARWRKLVAAAMLLPVGSEPRSECWSLLRTELATAAQAEAAAQLAEQAAADADLAADLRIRQAELTRDAKLAAELVWALHDSGRLGASRLDWACQVWNAAGRWQRVIDVCETQLRAGRALGDEAIDQLSQAYRAAGRHPAARRAASGRS